MPPLFTKSHLSFVDHTEAPWLGEKLCGIFLPFKFLPCEYLQLLFLGNTHPAFLGGVEEVGKPLSASVHLAHSGLLRRGGASLAFTAPQQVGGGAVTNRAQSDLGRAEERQRRRWGRPHTPGRELTFSEARAGVYFKTTAPPPRRRHSRAAKAAAAVATAIGRRAGKGGGGGGGRHSHCRRHRRRRVGGVGGGGDGRDGSFLRGRLRRQRCDCARRRRRHRSEARTIALAPHSR